jgi:hypothetical protein
MQITDLPALNAILNGTAAFFLVTGLPADSSRPD